MNNEMTLRTAEMTDLDTITAIYSHAVEVMKNDGIDQWDSLYPSRSLLYQDILDQQLFVCEKDNKIVSVLVINQEYDEIYQSVNWQYNESPYYVVHRLCVNPVFQGTGIGTKTMQIIENYLKNKGIASIRLDAFSLNPVSLKMYEKLGYIRVGQVVGRKGLYYLYEKKIG